MAHTGARTGYLVLGAGAGRPALGGVHARPVQHSGHRVIWGPVLAFLGATLGAVLLFGVIPVV